MAALFLIFAFAHVPILVSSFFAVFWSTTFVNPVPALFFSEPIRPRPKVKSTGDATPKTPKSIPSTKPKTPQSTPSAKPKTPKSTPSLAPKNLGGRPGKTFENKGKSARCEAVNKVVESANNSAECAMLGAKRLADDAELNDAAFIFKHIAKDPIEEGKSIREALKRPDGPIMLTPEEAWAHIVLTDQTKDNYKMERALQIAKRAKIYPDYNIVRKKKPEWMPPAEDIWFAADGFEAIVPMQSSLNFQMKRLLDESLIKKMKVIKTVQPNVRFRLYVKCGADGSSGHVQYQVCFQLLDLIITELKSHMTC